MKNALQSAADGLAINPADVNFLNHIYTHLQSIVPSVDKVDFSKTHNGYLSGFVVHREQSAPTKTATTWMHDISERLDLTQPIERVNTPGPHFKVRAPDSKTVYSIEFAATRQEREHSRGMDLLMASMGEAYVLQRPNNEPPWYKR